MSAMTTTNSTQKLDDEALLHNHLTRWITQHGGRVHPHLALHTPPTASPAGVAHEKETTTTANNDNDNDIVCDHDHEDRVKRRRRRSSHEDLAADNDYHNKENYTHRGIFANFGTISKGEELIRLPSRLALDGRDYPSGYSISESDTASNTSANMAEAVDGKRNASPWLRCLASIIYAWNQQQKQQQQQQSRCHPANDSTHDKQQIREREKYENNFYEPYLSTLPKSYDSLLNWKAIELQYFLKGTTLGVVALQDVDAATVLSTDTTSLDDKLESSLKKRYETTVVPYLKYLNDNGFDFLFGEKEPQDCKHVKKRKIDNSSVPRQAEPQNPSKLSNEPNDDESGAKSSKYDELYPLFRQGCMCISTRAFHMQSPELNDDLSKIVNHDHDADASPGYQGPYLLPYIDLLNHAPRYSLKHVTTLTRDPKDGSFVMVAERDIGVGEEICHSYDSSGVIADDDMTEGGERNEDFAETGRLERSSSLTSAQFLQTFGFVDVEEVVGKLSCLADRKNNASPGTTPKPKSKQTNIGDNFTPAILTKKEICRICRQVAQSPYPTSLQSIMESSGLVDEGWEYWDMPTPKSADEADNINSYGKNNGNIRQKALDHLPDEITVSFNNPLSDDLITILCLNFLPNDALAELVESSEDQGLVLGQDVLEDYFLGKLVLHSLLKVVSEKLEAYKVSFEEFQAGCKRCSINEKHYSDLLVLLQRLHCSNGSDGGKVTSESFCWGENFGDDIKLISNITTSELIEMEQLRVPNEVIQKLSYGLSVSLEERASLLELKRMAMIKFIQLDELADDDDIT